MKKSWFTHFRSIGMIILLGTGCILYPYWWTEGYLDNWYAKIGTFIACYPGLALNVYAYYMFLTSKK